MRQKLARYVILLALATSALLAGYALALLQQGDKPTAKELVESRDRLRHIGGAFIAYANAHADIKGDKWATDITGKDGHVLLSWRVALLPDLGEQELYEQFRLDEPWDSEHNKALVTRMPSVYAPVRGKAKSGETYYQRFVGKGAIFDEPTATPRVHEIYDGLSNTLLVVEAGEPVVWTKPADLPFDLKRPLPKLGRAGGDFHALLCDGSVILVRNDFDPGEMKRFITPAGGERVNVEDLKR
jgi:hypothetical protein